MAPTTRNINRRVETAIPMARFSIGEDDEEAPLTVKRQRFCGPASQSQRPFQRSQSRVAAEEDVEEEELIPVEDVESDSQGSEEEEDDEDDDEDEEDEDEAGSEDDSGDHGEAEPVLEGPNQQPRTCSGNVRSSSTALEGPNLQRRTCSGNVRSSSPVFNNSYGPLQAVLTDPDVLDCPICVEPLSPPVFQCENGHIACASCCCKVNRKCPSCLMPIGYNRCRAIEKVLETVMIACKYAHYGCEKIMVYSERSKHEQMCPHAVCFCPHPSCHFHGSSKDLYLHFGVNHAACSTRFTFNTTFTLDIIMNQKCVFLQERHESVIFILNHKVKEHGRAFNLDCVGPKTLKTSFTYQLTAKNLEGSLSLQCVPVICSRWPTDNTTLNKNYLLVPSDFSGVSGTLSLQVCIKKAF